MGIYDNSTTEEKPKKTVKIKKPMSKKKKIVTSLIAVIIVIALVITGVLVINNKNKSSSYSFVRTTTLSKGTLEESFSSTGTVESAATSNITTSLNYSIKSVLVAVGDKVKKGDVIATLDTSELESQIEREQNNLSNSKSQAQSSYNSASSSYSNAKSSLQTAKQNLSSSKADYTPAKSSYSNAKSSIKSYQNAYDTALSNYETAGAKYVKAQSEYNKAVSDYKKSKISKGSLVSVAKAYMTAVQNYSGGCNAGSYSIAESGNTGASTSMAQQSNANSNASIQITQTANSICDSVVQNVASLTGSSITYSNGNNTLLKLSQKLTALINAKNTCNYYSIESNYTSAKSAYDSAKQAVEQAEGSLQQAKSQYEQSKTQLESASSSDTLEELKQQLANCSLKAEQDGTVTALNATVGSTATSGMGNGAVATISDLSRLQVSITIAEANINKATIGMSCYITSDASDETLNGTLTQIDPVAGDDGSFGATVSVDSTDSSLKVGMNASVQLLISSKDDVFQVPIDAIGNDDNGDFVYRKVSGDGVDMEFEKVYVDKGDSNDYYIEISSDSLAQGDIIRSSSDLTQGIENGEKKDSSDSVFSIFGGGGMQGGSNNMPKGDFNSSGSNGKGNKNFTPPSGGFNG